MRVRVGMPWMSTCRARAQERRDRKDHGAEQRREEAAETHVRENLTMPHGNSRAGRPVRGPSARGLRRGGSDARSVHRPCFSRIISAAYSPMMTQGAWVFPAVTSGMVSHRPLAASIASAYRFWRASRLRPDPGWLGLVQVRHLLANRWPSPRLTPATAGSRAECATPVTLCAASFLPTRAHWGDRGDILAIAGTDRSAPQMKSSLDCRPSRSHVECHQTPSVALLRPSRASGSAWWGARRRHPGPLAVAHLACPPLLCARAVCLGIRLEEA